MSKILGRLRGWLKDESAKEYGGGRQHELRLWDWEVKELLEELERLEKCEAALRALLDDCEAGGFLIKREVEQQVHAALELPALDPTRTNL